LETISKLRYFINTVINTTSAGDEPAWHCRVVDSNYREVFNELFVEEEEVKVFRDIMDSDKGALLYRTHRNKVIVKLSEWKIDKHQKLSVKDGTRFP